MPEQITLFEASRRAATILLLASGRRVHDLTLLHCTADRLSVDSEGISIWPVFGAKTDSADWQQSGWRLARSGSSNIDPVYWTEKVIELSKARRAQTIQPSLFITTCGVVKAASRAVIAGWIKTVLRDAGVEDSPGSIRSAVASLNWVQNYKLDDILSRGNWKSPNTFARFYRREIAESAGRINTGPSVADLFQPL